MKQQIIESEKINLIKGEGKVLILEDEENIYNVLNSMLKHLGFDTVWTTTGNELIKIFEENKNKFKFAILDLTIKGGMGGKETVQYLKNIDSDFKVIVSSGYSNDEVLSNFRENGFDEILRKPYILEDLNKVILDLLKNK